MKTLIMTLLLLSGTNFASAFANEYQLLNGEEAYKLYLSLPGVRCTEWNSKDFVVYTKYQTQSCDEPGEDSQWTCTVQINTMRPQDKYVSADCTREVP